MQEELIGKFRETTALHKILDLDKRLRIIQGGSSAGKTIATLAILIDTAQSLSNKTISVVSETVPHLKRGAIRDFLNIMETQGYYDDSCWNRTDFIYTFKQTNTKIEFFSADNQDKVRGPRRDILFINECNNISYATYTQLAIRTNEYIFLDYNPVVEFWVHTEILAVANKEDYDFIVLTYKDNEALPETIVRELESRRGNKNFWTIYGEGQLGTAEGRIYKDWAIIDEIPHEARLERYGLDFGYTNDPSSIVAIYYYNGGYILDEILYQTGMSNRQIADLLKLQPDKVLTIADSAEPKSIDEIRSYGVMITGCRKGVGVISQGIQFIQDKRISVTKRSTNIIREYRNFLWDTDKDGKIINTPSAGQDHTMDALRYGFDALREKKKIDADPDFDKKIKAQIYKPLGGYR